MMGHLFGAMLGLLAMLCALAPPPDGYHGFNMGLAMLGGIGFGGNIVGYVYGRWIR